MLWTLRILLVLNALMAIAQPVMAGSYLSGNFDAIGPHGLNGSMMLGMTVLAGVAALVYAVRGGPLWPAFALAVLWFLEGIQVGVGYSGRLAIHVPLGVLVVAAAAWLAAWSFTPGARRRRARRTDREAVPA